MSCSETTALALELIRRPSLTPDDAGCQALLANRLQDLGFTIESLPFGKVSNLWARYGNSRPLLVYVGHTDVVPTGPLASWTHPPFGGVVEDGYLYGRGAADMKGSIAAMWTACARFLAEHPQPHGSLGLLLTSDEEGPAEDGTAKVVEHLQRQGVVIDWCLVGEPSSTRLAGDGIKNGRRGSLNGHLRVYGTQGHVAYPERSINPIHRFAPALVELTETVWDAGNEDFPPTTFQVSNIHAGTGADNVIPGELEVQFNLRFSTATTDQQLRDRIEHLLRRHGLDHHLAWSLTGQPFLTRNGPLLTAVREAIREINGLETVVSTTGGTSDGRFVAPTGAQVVELGPVNTTIHRIDERVRIEELDSLSRIFQRVLEKLLLGAFPPSRSK